MKSAFNSKMMKEQEMKKCIQSQMMNMLLVTTPTNVDVDGGHRTHTHDEAKNDGRHHARGGVWVPYDQLALALDVEHNLRAERAGEGGGGQLRVLIIV